MWALRQRLAGRARLLRWRNSQGTAGHIPVDGDTHPQGCWDTPPSEDAGQPRQEDVYHTTPYSVHVPLAGRDAGLDPQ